jgi:hypothetical protein
MMTTGCTRIFTARCTFPLRMAILLSAPRAQSQVEVVPLK